jgi:hypothetical protein
VAAPLTLGYHASEIAANLGTSVSEVNRLLAALADELRAITEL